ncbi:hypothetical protein [Kitasatospora sp. NPDC059327]|uniref:hypothetical protein n=1 Tax=Kitasatospora sp. NPDC059327 TaxID=3346803 RepID=UPI0036B4CC49
MRGLGEWGEVRAVVRWAGHPGTLGAVVVLLFNDHVGKRMWPGVVTGKVSDLAWMLVSPVVLALVLTPLLRLRGDRPAIVGLAGTAVMFGVAKSGPAGGELASAVWSWSGVPSRIQGDRSDLVALPALGIAWWLWIRARRTRRPWQWAAVAGVPLAVVAMVATSTLDPPSPHLWINGKQPVLATSDGWWTSQDGGATWTSVKHRRSDLSGSPELRPQDGHCVTGGLVRCYRLLDSSVPIEVSEDGGLTWRTAFDPGYPWREPLRPTRTRTRTPTPSAEGTVEPDPDPGPVKPPEPFAATPPPTPATPPPTPPTPVAPTPVASPGADRYLYPAQLLVVVAPEGWAVLAHYPGRGLVRGTPDGTWSFQDYPVRPARRPADAPGQTRSWALGLPVAAAAGFAGVLAATATRLMRATRAAGRRRELLLLALRQGICLLWVRLAAWLCGGELLWQVPGVLPAAVLTSGLLPMLWFLRHGPGPSGRRALVLPVLGAVFGAVASLPYLQWSAGRVAAWSQASDWAFLCALAATAAGIAVGWRGPGRAPAPAPSPDLDPDPDPGPGPAGAVGRGAER